MSCSMIYVALFLVAPTTVVKIFADVLPADKASNLQAWPRDIPRHDDFSATQCTVSWT